VDLATAAGALYEELCALEQRIQKMEEQIQQIPRGNALCQKIAAVEGIGRVTATAVVAAIADGRTFPNGRQFTAWIGLVPRQHSSGDKQRRFGITKRGDSYLHVIDSWREICRVPCAEQRRQP